MIRCHEHDKVIAFRRSNLLFLFNFNPVQSFPDYRIGVHCTASEEARVFYTLLLDSDDPEYGGHGRVDPGVKYRVQRVPCDGMFHSIMVYLPSRSAIVLVINGQ